MVYKIQSDESGTTKDYLFERGGSNFITNLRIRKEQPITSFTIPGQAATSTIILAFEGQKKFIDVDFEIVDNGTAVDNGTDASNPTTVQEQIEYINDNIFKPGLSTISFKIFGDDFSDTGTDVAIEDFTYNRKGGLLKAEGKLKLRVGSVS